MMRREAEAVAYGEAPPAPVDWARGVDRGAP